MELRIMNKKFGIIYLSSLLIHITRGLEIKGFDDSVIFRVNWAGRDVKDILEPPEAEPLVVATESNEKYMCLLPQIREKQTDNVEVYDGPNPLELLSPVFLSPSSCYYRIESYWKYELCHGKHIRQYHEEREGKKVKQQEYYLGKWDKAQHQKLYKELENMKSSETVPMKKIDGMNMPYLQINMTDGTICDVNKKPRFTKVLYVCYAHGKHEISSLKETSICEYEVVVLSPHLCKHPQYKPQESGENIINCHPLEGSPKKPKNLLALEEESLKLKQQKVSEEKLQQVFAVFSIDRSGEGQDGEPPKLRVEIHPVEMPIDSTEPDPVSPVPPTSPALHLPHGNNFVTGQHCIIGGTGWWKYEFCYGVSVSQFHIEKDGSKTILHLGKFDKAKHLEWLEKNPHKRPKPIASRKQISHLYSGGTLCDKTGKPRQTEVKLKCLENNASPGSVALFMYEPKTCEYILGVESPYICDILPYADENGLIKLAEGVEGIDDVTVSSEEEEEVEGGEEEEEEEEGEEEEIQESMLDTDDYDVQSNVANGDD